MAITQIYLKKNIITNSRYRFKILIIVLLGWLIPEVCKMQASYIKTTTWERNYEKHYLPCLENTVMNNMKKVCRVDAAAHIIETGHIEPCARN